MLDIFQKWIKRGNHETLDFSHQKILKDEQQNQLLTTQGYIVLPLLTPSEVDKMKDLYQKWHTNDQPSEFYKSYFSSNQDYINEVEYEIFSLIQPKFEQYFNDFDLIGGMFVVKPHGKEGHIPPHQDFSLVDETKFWALNSWCPLDDTSDDFGILKILPGSHRLMKTIRGYGIPKHFDHLNDTIEKEFVPIQMKAGEVVIFYLNIIHGSSYNLQANPRVAVGCSILQANSILEYNVVVENENQLRRYEVDKIFFTSQASKKRLLPDEKLLKATQPTEFIKLSKREFSKRMKMIQDSF